MKRPAARRVGNKGPSGTRKAGAPSSFQTLKKNWEKEKSGRKREKKKREDLEKELKKVKKEKEEETQKRVALEEQIHDVVDDRVRRRVAAMGIGSPPSSWGWP